MISPHEWKLGEYTVSSDPERLQLDVIHGFLSTSYWAQGIPRQTVEQSIAGSLPYGVYWGRQQVGFARVITDGATFAYLADVFVLEHHRSRGLAHWLVGCVLETPELQGLRRWLLVTRDAHSLYQGLGFHPVKNPDNFMEIVRGAIYRSAEGTPAT